MKDHHNSTIFQFEERESGKITYFCTEIEVI